MEQPKQENILYLQMEDKIAKLSIEVNIDELENLIEEMILKCSKVRRVENAVETSYYFKNYFADGHYRNVSMQILEEPYHDCGYGDDDHPGKRIVSYTHYDFPYLIDCLMDIVDGIKKGRNVNLNLHFPKSEKQKAYLDSLMVTAKSSEEYLRKVREAAEAIMKETENVTHLPEEEISSYYGRILDCFIVDAAEIMPMETIEHFLQYFTFINSEQLELEHHILNSEKMDPVYRKHLLEQMKELKDDPKKYTLY